MPRLRRVLLVTPSYHCGMVESAGVWMPLGLAYLSGSLKASGFDSTIFDAMSRFDSPADTIAGAISEKPDVVAVTAYTATLPAAVDLLAGVTRALPHVVTVIGGVHPTHMAEEVLGHSSVDYVVRGEGEGALPELLACLNTGDNPAKVAGISCRDDSGNATHAPDRALCADLDALPIDWDGLEWPLYHYRTKPGSKLAITSWARGCTMSCRFCSQQKLWRRTWRARDVESIVAEMRMLKERYGVDTLEVADEHPTFDRARWEHLLDRLIEEDLGIELLAETRADDVVRDADIIGKYRDAGILHMYVGVESPRQDKLDWMGKHLRIGESKQAIDLLNDVGIITETSFLLGYPDDTPETVAQSLELSEQYQPDLAFFLAITPWPYADMYSEVADRIEVDDYSQYNLINPIIKPDGMTRQELSAMLSRAFGTFYMHKMQTMGTMQPHKRQYLAAVTKLLMEESYLSREVGMSMAMMSGHAAAPAMASSQAHPGGHPGSRPPSSDVPTNRPMTKAGAAT